MTPHNHQIIAYLATLLALVIVFIGALIAAAVGNLSSLEALGVGTVTGGLIGALRMPSQHSITVDNAPSDPVPTQAQPLPSPEFGPRPGDH